MTYTAEELPKVTMETQVSTERWPLVIPQISLDHARKHEDRPFIGVYTKYNDRALATCQSLLPALKEVGMDQVDGYLDIGCGLGANSALVAKMLHAQRVHLIDGDGTAPRKTSWNEVGSAWNDVMAAASLVVANVPSGTKVLGHYQDHATYPIAKIGLITSFKSWGHHYPISSYVKLAQTCLLHGGIIVTDIRNNTNGFTIMKSAGFKHIKDIENGSKKCRRAVFSNA